ncbi:MAG: NAD(P)H-dependent oxidoreductase [Oscillospiraceae bacterium]|nr:NAD(P)H-dependent oxidoreductase [Oscillospiraceae bacterium]
MNISIINGSPKPGESTSGLLIKYLLQEMGECNVQVFKCALQTTELAEIASSDVLVLVFPLYVDSIPSQLLQLLIILEELKNMNHDMMVYCIVNNGFFEGTQNYIAIQQIKNWCTAADLNWGQGIGIGAGEMLPFIADVPLKHGPNKNIGYAISSLATNLLNKKSGKDSFVSPNWPRFLWRMQSTKFFWIPRARSNSLKKQDLYGGVKRV